MDTNSIIAAVIGIVATYLFIKLIVSPLIKAILGVIIFVAVIYVLQHFFNIDFSTVLGPFGKYLNLTNWNIDFSGIIRQIENYTKHF